RKVPQHVPELLDHGILIRDIGLLITPLLLQFAEDAACFSKQTEQSKMNTRYSFLRIAIRQGRLGLVLIQIQQVRCFSSFYVHWFLKRPSQPQPPCNLQQAATPLFCPTRSCADQGQRKWSAPPTYLGPTLSRERETSAIG